MGEREFVYISGSSWTYQTGAINLDFFYMNLTGLIICFSDMINYQTAMTERNGLDKIHK